MADKRADDLLEGFASATTEAVTITALNAIQTFAETMGGGANVGANLNKEALFKMAQLKKTHWGIHADCFEKPELRKRAAAALAKGAGGGDDGGDAPPPPPPKDKGKGKGGDVKKDELVAAWTPGVAKALKGAARALEIMCECGMRPATNVCRECDGE